MPADRRIIDGPFLASLETLSLYIRTVMNGRLGGSHRSRTYGDSTEFTDYREYIPGDDLRRIDWNLVGRLDQYFIKQFVAERQLRNHIYLDMSASMDNTLNEQKAITALKLAVAVGYLSVQDMDRVTYRLLRGTKCLNLCDTIVGRDSFYRAAEMLGSLEFAADTDLGQALRDDPDPGFDDGLSIIISDFLTDSDWQTAVDQLISRRREVILIRVSTPEERNPQYFGPFFLTDAERKGEGLRLQIDRGALAAYRQAVAYFEQTLSSFCASRGVTLIDACCDEPIERIILQKGLVA